MVIILKVINKYAEKEMRNQNKTPEKIYQTQKEGNIGRTKEHKEVQDTEKQILELQKSFLIINHFKCKRIKSTR